MKEILFKTKNFSVVREDRTTPDGRRAVLEYIVQPEVVVAVPVLADGSLVLVEHIRPILNTTLLECPGGKMDDPSERQEDCIRRELEEEIGYTAAKLTYVSYLYTSVGSSTEKIHIYIANGLTPHQRRESDIVRMRVRICEPARVKDLLLSNGIYDAKTELALFKYFISVGNIQPT